MGHLQLVLRLRTNRAIPPPPPFAFIKCYRCNFDSPLAYSFFQYSARCQYLRAHHRPVERNYFPNFGLAKNSVNKFQTIVLQQTDCITLKLNDILCVMTGFKLKFQQLL